LKNGFSIKGEFEQAGVKKPGDMFIERFFTGDKGSRHWQKGQARGRDSTPVKRKQSKKEKLEIPITEWLQDTTNPCQVVGVFAIAVNRLDLYLVRRKRRKERKKRKDPTKKKTKKKNRTKKK